MTLSDKRQRKERERERERKEERKQGVIVMVHSFRPPHRNN